MVENGEKKLSYVKWQLERFHLNYLSHHRILSTGSKVFTRLTIINSGFGRRLFDKLIVIVK